MFFFLDFIACKGVFGRKDACQAQNKMYHNQCFTCVSDLNLYNLSDKKIDYCCKQH